MPQGERVSLRVFYGRYVDVWGSYVDAQWVDKGAWQSFVFCHPGGRSTSEVRDGDTVLLRAHNRRYLSVGPDDVVRAAKVAGPAERFVVHVGQGRSALCHSGVVYLENKASRKMLDADNTQDGIFARYADHGHWQQFAVEKALPKGHCEMFELGEEAAAPPTPKNRRRSVSDAAPALLLALAKRRRSSSLSPPQIALKLAESPSFASDRSPGALSVGSGTTMAPSLDDTPDPETRATSPSP